MLDGAGAQGLAEKIENMGGFAGAGGSREQPHRLQCSAGRRKNEERKKISRRDAKAAKGKIAEKG